MSSTTLRIGRLFATALLFSTAACGLAGAAPKQTKATPATFVSVLSRASDGDTIVLAPGEYKALRIRDVAFKTPVVIDAGAATIVGLNAANVSGLTFRGGDFRVPPPITKPSTGEPAYAGALRFDKVSNITIRGGTFTGPGDPKGEGVFGEGYGVQILGGSDIVVADSRFIGLKAGVVLNRIEGFKVTGNHIAGSRSDGIVAGESHNGLIEKNECVAFHIRDKEHPDCIQMWSRPTTPPVSDIVIRSNRAEGNMQGIGLFNHTTKGADDGGYDRITIENNDMRVGYPHGIALVSARDSIVRNNRVSTFPGARWRASINVGQTVRCGNIIEAGASLGAVKEKACQN